MADIHLKSMVNELIKNNGDKERLFDALRRYQSGQDLSRLLGDMQDILDEPSKLELFEHMRPLILLHHQVAYSQLMPTSPGVKVRIVRLRRRQYESLGFAVRGGLEHGVGVFVTDVKAGSQADKQGLMIGDEILGVNGFTISEAIHDDVLNLIKSRDDIILKVTHVGMLPTKENPTSNVKWRYTEKESVEIADTDKDSRNLKIFVDSTGHHSLGCGILSGPPHLPGIFVERVRPGSLAEEVNLEPGDQILEVNGTAFQRIGHKEAVLALVSSRQLNITIRKGVGVKLVNQPIIPTIKNESSTSSSTSSAARRGDNHLATPSTSLSPASTGVANSSSSSNVPSNNWSTYSHTQGVMTTTTAATTKDNESRLSSTSSIGLTQVEIHSDKSSSTSSSPSPSQSLSPAFSPAFSAALSWNNETKNREASSAVAATTTTTTTVGGGGFMDSADRNDGLREQLREEIKSRLGSTQNSPLSGAAAIMEQRRLGASTRTPEFLGYGEDFQYNDMVSNKVYDMFTNAELDGRNLHSLVYNKKMDLGVSVEGGLGSPLSGKILVAMVFDNGAAKKSGKMRVGDQLMSVNNKKLIDVTVTKADTIIEDASAYNSQEMVELIFCQSTLVNEEESMTYF